MTQLFPSPADDGLFGSKHFFRSMRASRKVRQSRFNKVFRHDEPCGFQTWIGGPPGSAALPVIVEVSDLRFRGRHQRERVGADGMPWAARSLIGLGPFELRGSVAIVSGVIERVQTVHSSLAGDTTTLLIRTADDVLIVVWRAIADEPPAPGAVFSGQVALCGVSDQLTSA